MSKDNTELKDGPGTYVLSDAENAEIEANCKQIASERGLSGVIPVVMIQEGTFKRVIAYLQEPPLVTKIYIMDQVTKQGAWGAASNLMDMIMLKDISDPLTTTDVPECHPYILGVVRRCVTIIDLMVDHYKKK